MFRIGEFSKIAQVSGSQLRYYDEIGLLKPARIDEWTGYRYYSAAQLPRLNRILALKELGLSLDQIRRMLDEDISEEEIRGMFALKKAQAEQAVRDELARLRSIEARLDQIKNGDSFSNFDIVVKAVPAQPFLSLRKVCTSFESARTTLFNMYKALPSVIGEKNLGYFTAILMSEVYETGEFDLDMGFTFQGDRMPTVPLPDGQIVATRILPAVETMVTAVHVGPLEASLVCRGAMAGWVESNGYVFAGNGREQFIVPPFPGKEHETVVEIQYPVIRQENVNLLAA